MANLHYQFSWSYPNYLNEIGDYHCLSSSQYTTFCPHDFNIFCQHWLSCISFQFQFWEFGLQSTSIPLHFFPLEYFLFKKTLHTLACSKGFLLRQGNFKALQSLFDLGRWYGKTTRNFYCPTPPLSFLLIIAHPLSKYFLLSRAFHCWKSQRWQP